MRYFRLEKLGFVCLLLLLVSAAGLPEEKQISIYSNVANYSLPVTEANGRDYVGIFELLDPLGKVSVKTDGSHWNIRYNDIECDFKKGNETARLQGQDMHLGANFVLQNNRGFVPINSLSSLLPKLLGGPVTVNEAARRVFVGNVGVHFTAQIKNNAPSALVMDFTSQVNPAISTEPGKLKLIFTHEPLMSPGTPVLTFASKEIVSASYSEINGAAEITIAGRIPLFASFSNNGKTITVAAAPQQTATKSPTTSGQTLNNSQSSQPFFSTISHRYFAVIDASHGGDESGATLGNQLVEKDITLAIARQLRDELEVRNVSVLLLRDTDVTLTTDQRASTANQQHPAIYICIHASSQGRGVRLYTALIPAGENHGPFLDWQTAQAPFLSSSQTAMAALASALQKSHIPVRQLTAPLRPLNSIVSSAVAVEVALPAGSSTAISPEYEQIVAASLADGIVDLQNPLRGTP